VKKVAFIRKVTRWKFSVRQVSQRTAEHRSCLYKFFDTKTWSLLSELPDPYLFIVTLTNKHTAHTTH